MVNWIQKPDDSRIIHIYESIGEYLDYIQQHPDRAEGASHRSEYTGGRLNGWYGTNTFQEALELARTGWHESRPKVDALLDPLREKLAEKLSMVPQRAFDMIGYEPDIDRYLAGEIECMYEDVFTEAPHQGRVFTLLISGAVNAHVSGETLMKRGVAIVALVEAFQVVGCDVEIWTEESYKPGGYNKTRGKRHDSISWLTRVHRAGDNLDVDSIMFALAHPSWFRRFSFAAAENEPGHIRDEFGFRPHQGYGYAADLCAEDVIEPTFTLTKGGGSRNGAKMDSDPLGFILDTLKAQGAFHDETGED